MAKLHTTSASWRAEAAPFHTLSPCRCSHQIANPPLCSKGLQGYHSGTLFTSSPEITELWA